MIKGKNNTDKEKDHDKFNGIYRIYGKYLYGIGMNILKNEDHVDEALQQCFIKIYENIDKIDDVNAANALNQQAALTSEKYVRSKIEDFGTYRLEMAQKKSGQCKVFVDPDPNRLNNYVKESKGLAGELATKQIINVPVTVTFNKPLSQEEVEKIFDGLEFTPSEFYGRVF